MFSNHIFKYRSWSDTFHKRLLTRNEIYFPSAQSFNDPFDCQISVKYNGLTKDEIIKIIIVYLRSEEPNLSDKERNNKAIEIEKTKFYTNQEHLRKHEILQKKHYSVDIGICSFAGNCENIVMWSHYADSHRGVCFCFDTIEFQKSFQNILDQHGLIVNLYPIKYSKEYPKIHRRDFSDDYERGMIISLTTKSKKWEYEEESRLISINKVNRSLQLDDGIITSIILGCKIPSKDKNEILEIISKKNSTIKVFEAKMKDNEFGLDFNRIK